MADEQIIETDHEAIESGLDDIMAAIDTPPATDRDPETGRFVARQESEADDAVEADPVEDLAPDEPTSEEDEGEDIEPDVPTIDPPTFWTAEEREAWNSLTPEAQEVILAKETERDAYVARLRNESSEARKKFEADLETTIQERQRYAEVLRNAHQLHTALDAVLGDQTDWQQLAQDDPGEYVAKKAAYDQRMGLLTAIRSEIDRVGQQQASDARSLRESKLREAMPEFGDASKSALAPILQDAGFSSQEIASFWDDIPDPRYVRVLNAALEGRKLKDARKTVAQKKAQPQPNRIQRPRAADTPKKGPSNRVKAMEKKAGETGRMSDMADFLTAALMEGNTS